MIQIKNLTKKYGEAFALNDVSFEIHKGEVVGFLGPNGAGKSTTMKIITTFISPTSGSVNVAGMDILDNSLEIRKKIGYLPENVPLYEDMKTVEYLQFIGKIRGLKKTELSERIKKMIEVCGLKKVSGKNIGELSKGYRQRVGLAQAMIHNPEILILDEPTTGLDPNQIAEIRSLIKEIGKDKTVILSTHILPEVSATCSRAIIINNGKIAAEGTTKELTSRLQSKNVVYAKIKGSKSDVLKKLSEMENVESAKETDLESQDVIGYKIEAKDNADLREYLFMTVVKNGWSLLELRQEETSLEDVFRELTK
ncbi:MAG: ATP-binding cassette domain-containing protein [bacterium]